MPVPFVSIKYDKIRRLVSEEEAKATDDPSSEALRFNEHKI